MSGQGVRRLHLLNPETGEPLYASEAERLAAALARIKADAEVPYQCGDAIPVAPARGKVRMFRPVELMPDAKGELRQMDTGYRGRSGAYVGDVFDRMTDQAERSHAAKPGSGEAFEPPFSYAQVQIGRDYAALTERCHSSGVKCSSLEALRQASSGGGDREEAMLADYQRLRSFHGRIGDGMAKQLRRRRPSKRGNGEVVAVPIKTRYLVDQVCLADFSLLEIIQACGWRKDGKLIKDLRAVLCAALDRMQGYDLRNPQNMG